MLLREEVYLATLSTLFCVSHCLQSAVSGGLFIDKCRPKFGSQYGNKMFIVNVTAK